MDLKWAGLRARSDARHESNACFLRHILQVRYAQRSGVGYVWQRMSKLRSFHSAEVFARVAGMSRSARFRLLSSKEAPWL